ncbi:MAG TPA: beta-galactosidase GalA [Lacunisphaera sp.]
MTRKIHLAASVAKTIAILAASALLPSLRLSAVESPRVTQSLDENWLFHLGEAPGATDPRYDDRMWRRVDVPHDYVVEGRFEPTNPFPAAAFGRAPDWYSQHGSLPVQPAVYRKGLDIPSSAQGKRLWLELDGVFSNSRYWLNGHEVGTQYSGYTRSRFDITAAAIPGGENILTVQVDPRYDGWWYEGGGIYRHVRLVTVDPVHIAPDGVFVAPNVDDPGNGANADAVVAVNTDLTNTSSAPVSAIVSSEVLDATGHVIASASSIRELGVSTGLTVTERIPLARAQLWSVENPYLYRLRSTVSVAGKVIDQVTTNFGVRHVRFDAERGFFLNGKSVKLHGVNIHQDHAGVGVAVPDRLHTWRLERLKELGCNAIRLSHNPVAPFLLDECDRMGILVVAENRHLGDTYVDQSTKDVVAIAHRDLSALVLRDRNHPSIILWSMCNEQWIQGSTEAAAMIRAMKQRVRELDPTRPITAAMNGGFDSAAGMASELDVIGINYNPSVYDSMHKLFPGKPMIATETASELGTRGIYATERWDSFTGDRARGYLSAYGLNALAFDQPAVKSWAPVATRDFIGGGFVWAGFDYKGEPRPFEWPCINSNLGLMDICGFPKDMYYFYKAAWNDTPVLHVFPHWNWAGREGQEIPVWVYSNCDDVELFLNGVSLGKQSMQPLDHLEWKVRYAPGQLVAKATRKGVAVETKIETTGAPAAIRLIPDRTALAADNVDLAVVKVEVVDAQGRVVPTAGDKIAFTLSGPAKLIGVGNGDPSCHEPDKADSRSAFNGLAQAIIQTKHEAGTVKLSARAEGLASAEETIVIHSAR